MINMDVAAMLLAPPITFLIYLLISAGISMVSRRYAARGTYTENKARSYACGEDLKENRGQPDYSEFFKFAFFFTIMHVIALVVATDSEGLSIVSAVYIGVTALALFMVLRK